MVTIGNVETFKNPKPDKAQATKVLEEAAEVFGAWQQYDKADYDIDVTVSRQNLVMECADVIQAVCNLLQAVGVEDMTIHMSDCASRNRARGRM